MKLLFIVNPIAGNGVPLRAIPFIKKYCQQHNIQYQILKTQYKGHATLLARDAIPMSYHAVVAVGGDGTIMEVANGLVGSSTPLGILPLGTGNDLSKALNIPSHVDKALSIIVNGKARFIDTITYEHGYFFNVASVGFDAEIARDIVKIKRWIPGKAAYYASVFIKFLTYKDKYVSLEIDGIKYKTKILLLAIANGTHYGGGMNVNPRGSIDDGYIDVILVKPVPRYKFPFLFWKFVAGQHLNLPYVSTYRCKSIEIQSSEDLPVNGDGDIIATTPIRFSVSNRSILIYY